MKVSIIGQGYVGLPLAYKAWGAGYDVVGYDTDVDKVNRIKACNSPIEDVSNEDLAWMTDVSNNPGEAGYIATNVPEDMAGSDVFVVTVPTPLDEHGEPDLQYLTSAAHTIAPYVLGKTVIVESTVAPGTTEGPFADAIMRRTGHMFGVDYNLAFSPERIDPGNSEWNINNTPKLIAGTDAMALASAMNFYRGFVEEPVPMASIREAEMAKLLENTYRHVNIALVNEMGRHAHAMGIDFHEVLRGAATKPYGFMPFTHGPGVGGHCLPIDSVYLGRHIERDLGIPSRFIDLAVEVNNSQPKYIAHRAMLMLNEAKKPVNGAKILVMGYAYKANTGDFRETPVSELVSELAELGAEIVVCDTYIAPPKYLGFEMVEPEDVFAVAKHADLVIIATAHAGFEPYYEDIESTKVPVLDTRNVGRSGFQKL